MIKNKATALRVAIKHWLFVERAVGVKSLLSLTSNRFCRLDNCMLLRCKGLTIVQLNKK